MNLVAPLRPTKMKKPFNGETNHSVDGRCRQKVQNKAKEAKVLEKEDVN